MGFDGEGILKIFDFGLAKELKDSERTEDGLYQMTGMTGALRYMAPEVGLGNPYNLSADVYSWSMIMWYILALEPPFGMYTPDMIADRVFKRGSRPAIFRSWPETIANVMQRAWSPDISFRPSFGDIRVVLKHELIFVDSDSTVGGSSLAESSNPSLG
jgi:serine/threonine protein kinase